MRVLIESLNSSRILSFSLGMSAHCFFWDVLLSLSSEGRLFEELVLTFTLKRLLSVTLTVISHICTDIIKYKKKPYDQNPWLFSLWGLLEKLKSPFGVETTGHV